MGEEEGEEVSYTSGCQRLLNSILCALCVAPVLALGSCYLLGWNEQRAVCDAKAIAQGKEEVVELGCSSAGEGGGDLVMFSCDLSKDGLSELSFPGAFATAVQFQGTGLAVASEMYQCKEDVDERTETTTGGGKKTIKTYTYETAWSSSHIDSSAFHATGKAEEQCGTGWANPSWPAEVPNSGQEYASQVKAGAFTLTSEFVRHVPLDTEITANTTSVPAGWLLSSGWYATSAFRTQSSGTAATQVGDVRIQFKGNNWAQPKVTALGQNTGGTISRWTAGDSWLCSGFTLLELSVGTQSKDELFKSMQEESNAVTYVLRVVGFLLIWFALSRVAAPLGVVADCIPCIGPCLGDMIEAIACAVACLPACACAMGVIGVVWVAMRPMVGIPLMVVFCCVMGGFVGFSVYQRQQRAASGGDLEENKAGNGDE